MVLGARSVRTQARNIQLLQRSALSSAIGVIQMKKVIGFIGVCLFIVHLAIIASDAQAVIEDPNEANKPGEILKLVFDISRYGGPLYQVRLCERQRKSKPLCLSRY